MPKIRNKTGEDRILPWLNDRLVMAGQVVDVPEKDVYAYTQQEGWDPADSDAQDLHDEAASQDEAVALVESGQNLTEPGGNASRSDWFTYVVGANLAPIDALDGLTRDQLRDTYGTTKDEE